MKFESMDGVLYFSISGLENVEATPEMEERTSILAIREIGKVIKKTTSLDGDTPILIPDDDGNNHSCTLWWTVQSQFKDQVQS